MIEGFEENPIELYKARLTHPEAGAVVEQFFAHLLNEPAEGAHSDVWDEYSVTFDRHIQALEQLGEQEVARELKQLKPDLPASAS